MTFRTEDQVRNQAGITLGFIDAKGNNVETTDYLSGVGQVTSFIQLGTKLGTSDFMGISDKPDGWFLPFNQNGVAIVLETKSEKEDVLKKKWETELIKNIEILQKHYTKVAGILYNGKDCRVFMNQEEVISPAAKLQRLEYYTQLFVPDTIDKGRIYELTKKINNCLHKEFGVKNLNHRMIFTACALVAVKEGAILHKGTEYSLFHQTILNQLSKSLKEAKKQNEKLDLLCEVYSEIKMNTTNNQVAIDNFIDWVNEISDLIKSDKWNGEDVMAIFFNEFNRYKGKSERGQVFTPDHITSFMYRLIDVTQKDVVLDAACGSGAFLVKKYGNKVLKDHRLTTIVKLPEKTFSGVTASIFVFESGKPQNEQNIIGYYIEEDGLETVKNQGRQDIKNRWDDIENYWIQAIHDGVDPKYNTRQIINPTEHLSYQMPEKPFEICEEDFLKTMMDYEMYKRGIDVKAFGKELLDKIVYSSKVVENENQSITVTLKGKTNNEK